ncbi:MAG: NAD(P)H-dependent glycerol-3-phosphate dehydrogenase [Caldimicrobium sp.]|nr:NAD(P)H-dependent glycerol-3-phosphate dehydrogenase [Caldimicrobium sp.]MCX7873261.1 NAD(P)H-dependent glycerol-3-phosphate dehydrogenase [Caldimicrobium sp.]MDW8094717.1 NAD(P)H-dependent glycerol-3-phosphate dehydrogenase [Caldimicrobium sp.]
MLKIAIVGAGSWGTALGKVLAEKAYEVYLLARRREIVSTINREHINPQYLPGIKLPSNLKATLSPGEALTETQIVIWTIPSHALEEVLLTLKSYLKKSLYHVSGIKGMDIETGKSPLQILRSHLGEDRKYFVLGGPSFAFELAQRLPTAVVLAGFEKEATTYLQEVFAWKYLRVYRSYDPLGVELAGALKNVIAIAAGISDGLALGLNARAGLISRGLRELERCGIALGGKRETFYGLAGLGDLVLTCTGTLSRNYQVGLRLAQGKNIERVLEEIGQVAEGVKTVSVIKRLAEERALNLPICEEVYKIIYEGEDPRNSLKRLLSRSLKDEFEEEAMENLKLVVHVPDPARFEAGLKVSRNFALHMRDKKFELRILVNYEGVKVLQDFSSYMDLYQEVLNLGGEVYFCETALRSLNFSKDMLPKGAKTIPSGIVALAEWQQEGFSYVRA